MRAMSYLELLFAALAAGASASVVYVGSITTSREDLTTLDVDMATMTAMITFFSMLVAQHPEWVI
jgi:phage protein D